MRKYKYKGTDGNGGFINGITKKNHGSMVEALQNEINKLEQIKQKEKNRYQNRKNCSKKEKQQVEKTKEQQSKAEKSENSYEPYAARDHSSDRVDHNKSGQ